MLAIKTLLLCVPLLLSLDKEFNFYQNKVLCEKGLREREREKREREMKKKKRETIKDRREESIVKREERE